MIHYHGTPCSGTQDVAAKFLSKRHSFVSWAARAHLAISIEVCQSFAVDNGAFSAWKAGTPIESWGEYYEWVGSLIGIPSFDWAIVPDVVDGSEDENNSLVKEWPHNKINGVPVWHLHESLDRLRRMSREWPRIALGSSGDYSNPGNASWWRRIAEAMDVICCNGVPVCKIHGLRMLDPAIFHRLPLSSADSTNAARNGHGLGVKLGLSSLAGQVIIADRVESHSSSKTWVSPDRQGFLVFDKCIQ